MAERKFTKGLSKPGSAAQVRETVREAVRESTVLSRPQLVEPIDYETFIQKNRTILQNDPQRELLLYPQDDVYQKKNKYEYRTEISSVPSNIDVAKISSLFVRECIKSYTNDWHMIHYKYSCFSGNYSQLPALNGGVTLQDQVYEVDVENDNKDLDHTGSIGMGAGIIKEGFLLRGPESGSDHSFISLATKSFKRRFVSLRQEVDGAYILEFHKDDKKSESKGAVYMDFCREVGRASKRGKYGFILHFNQGHGVKSCVLSAESERESEDWIDTLNQIVVSSLTKSDSQRRISLTNGDGIVDPNTSAPYGYGTLKSLEHSMNPDLVKYSRETDYSITQARKENRQKLFQVHPNMPNMSSVSEAAPCETDVDAEPFSEKFGLRFLVKCESIQFRLQLPVQTENPSSHGQVEPYITSIALYDARKGRKISEDFCFDVNDKHSQRMLDLSDEALSNKKQDPEIRQRTTSSSSNNSIHISPPTTPTSTPTLTPGAEYFEATWLAYPKQAIFTVQHKDPEIYLVVKIEKCLQGGISQAVEPYTRNAADMFKLAIKVHKVSRACCQRLKGYKQPMAWAARPVFKPFSMELDTHTDFSHIYRQEGSKLSDEDFLRNLADFKRPEKMSRFQIIPGKIKITVSPLPNNIRNCVTSSYLPVKPFTVPPSQPPTFEVAQFLSDSEKDSWPFSHYVNHLYVFPKSLKYEAQKIFVKARNISLVVEFRDSDEETAKPLSCIYKKCVGGGRQLFTSQARAAVTHHNTCPDFYEEIKILLPVQLHQRHHLLFKFYHISCEPPKAKHRDLPYESIIGYTWLPILSKGRLNVDDQALPVSTHLPSGYLSCQPLGLGKGFSGPDIRWVDGGKQVFKIDFKLVSTVNTKDQHLCNFFNHCQKLQEHKFLNRGDLHPTMLVKDDSTSAESATGSELGREMSKYVKALHAVDVAILIQFLPTILNQLFRLLTNTASEDVSVNAVRVLVHIVHELSAAGKEDALRTYVKFVFNTETTTDAPSKKKTVLTIHEELTKSLTTMLRPANTDFLVINKFLSHSWFFFQILIKSMAQHLLNTERIKMHRHERFPSDYQFRIQSLIQVLTPHILNKHKEMAKQTRKANASLAYFIKKCLTFMDRGFVFSLINFYMDKFNPGDPKVLCEYKFEFLQIVCSHEHFISLNLPVLRGMTTRGTTKKLKDFEQEFFLCEEFCKHHFLVGLLLQEFRAALNEVRDDRKIATKVLRDLLAKHSFDKRYQNKAQQARITSLYLPLIVIVIENINRLRLSSSCPVIAPDLSDHPDRRSRHTPSTPSIVNLASNSSQPSTPNKRATISVAECNSASTRSPKMQLKHLSMRDSSYLSIIAGGSSPISNNRTSIYGSTQMNGAGSQESVASTSTLSEQNEQDSLKNGCYDTDSINADSLSSVKQGHCRTPSVPFAAQGPPLRYDKFDESEIKDLFVCFLYVIKNLNEALLLGWWDQHTQTDVIDFFDIMQLCLHQFKYPGKKHKRQLSLARSPISSGKSMTLPARTAPPVLQGRSISTQSDYASRNLTPTRSEQDLLRYALLEANMSTEVGLIVLDILSLYTTNMKDKLLHNDGENLIMDKIFHILLSFLQIGQSETLLKHVFAAIRAFLNKFPVVLFKGNASFCGSLCFELLKCCNCHLSTTRLQASAILYLLMRGNYEFTNRRGLTRVHLQVIVSVSQLLGEITGLNNSRFQQSLSTINNYANSDKAMQHSSFPSEVKDLTKRVRTVLMATVQLKEHESDPEMLTDHQHSLANSYASTPALRKTWLETMARNHVKNNNLSEAAFCYIHIAALQAQYLKQKGLYPYGCQAFSNISPNIERDETNLKEDSGMQEIQYTEESLLEVLEVSCELLDRAERYELIGEVCKLIIPLYEKKRNYVALVSCYKSLHVAYCKVVDVNKSGKRLLGTYFRVAFFGQPYFKEDTAKEYIYKEPKVTSLAEVSQRLYHQFCEKFGKEVVKIIMDSNQVDAKLLDEQYAYIQVTHVTPYFDELDLDTRPTDFERNNNLRRFMFETPFTQGSKKAHGSIEIQCKRRTILTTLYNFPYVKKRIPVFATQVEELSPIEVAIDEMKTKVQELERVVSVEPTDLKKLQLHLQGCVSVQVNAGPMAYASCFLDKGSVPKYPINLVHQLQDIFRHFVSACQEALELNERLVTSDQYEYHESLRTNFSTLQNLLSKILQEQVTDGENSLENRRTSKEVFSYISATPDSSTA